MCEYLWSLRSFQSLLTWKSLIRDFESQLFSHWSCWTLTGKLVLGWWMWRFDGTCEHCKLYKICLQTSCEKQLCWSSLCSSPLCSHSRFKFSITVTRDWWQSGVWAHQTEMSHHTADKQHWDERVAGLQTDAEQIRTSGLTGQTVDLGNHWAGFSSPSCC